MGLLLTSAIPAAGLQSIFETFRDDWAGPIFLILVVALALFAVWKREWRGLFGLVAIATVVGLLIFAGEDLFGSKDATLTSIADDAANDLNVITAPLTPGE